MQSCGICLDFNFPISVYQVMAFAELGVRASYFGGGAGWFSLVGGTIPFSRI
jgi:hypothetical protein